MRLDSVKLVSWDVDGTLYSIRSLKWQVLGKLLSEIVAGRGRVATKELAALRRHWVMIEAARLDGGALNDALRHEISREMLLEVEKRWYGQAIRRTGPRSGATELMAFLVAQNIPQVALSDHQCAYKLDSLGLKDRFESIYEGERLGFVKPSPQVFERVASDFAVPTRNILHIGDRVDTDDAGARAAGCQCLILGRDFESFGSLLKDLRSPR